MSSELEKSRLAIADEVKFNMLAAISELGNHKEQYKAISRNFVCGYLGVPVCSSRQMHLTYEAQRIQ